MKNDLEEFGKAKHDLMMIVIHKTQLGRLLKFVIKKLGMQLKEKYKR